MATYIPNGLEQLQAPIDSLISTITRQHQDPNYQFQQMMRAHFVSNPDQLQKWIDMEKTNPGISQRLGLGGLGDIVGQSLESPEGQAIREDRNAVVQGTKTNIQAKQAEAQISLDLANKAKAALVAGDPDTAFNILKHATSQEVAITKAEAEAAPIIAKAKIAGAEFDVSQANLSKMVTDRALIDFPKIGQTDFYKVAQDMMAGKADSKQIMSLFATPGAREALMQSIDLAKLNTEIAARKTASDLNGDKLSYKDKFYLQKAFTMFDQTKRGTLEAWQSYLEGGTAKAEEAEKYSSQPQDKLTTTQRDLVAVHEVMQHEHLEDTMKETNEFNNQFSKALNDIRLMENSRNVDKSMITGSVDNLNNLLDARSKMDGKLYIAHYGKVPNSGLLFDNTGLYFTDASGNNVSDAQVAAGVTPKDSTLQGRASRLYMQYEGLVKNPGESVSEFGRRKQQFLDDAKARATSSGQQDVFDLFMTRAGKQP